MSPASDWPGHTCLEIDGESCRERSGIVPVQVRQDVIQQVGWSWSVQWGHMDTIVVLLSGANKAIWQVWRSSHEIGAESLHVVLKN